MIPRRGVKPGARRAITAAAASPRATAGSMSCARAFTTRIHRSSVDDSAPWAESEPVGRGSMWWAHLVRGRSALANGHGGEAPRESVGSGSWQELRAEAAREQLLERDGLVRAAGGDDVDGGVERHELAQALAAAAARDARLVAVADHRRLGDLGVAGGDQRADRRRLRAPALGVGGVLDVGADV